MEGGDDQKLFIKLSIREREKIKDGALNYAQFPNYCHLAQSTDLFILLFFSSFSFFIIFQQSHRPIIPPQSHAISQPDNLLKKKPQATLLAPSEFC